MPEQAAPPSIGAAPSPVPAPGRPTTRGLKPSKPRAPDTGAASSEQSRSLEAEFPERVQLGSVATLSVFIASEAPSEHGLALEVRADDRIDIVVQPRSGFMLDESDDRARITVPESGESKYVQFKLKAVEAGPASIRVRAFRAGEPLGLISLESVVVPEAGVRFPTRVRSERGRDGSRRRARSCPTSPCSSRSGSRATTPNIGTMLTANDPALELNLHTYGPFTLELDPAKFFDEFFTEIEKQPLGTSARARSGRPSAGRQGGVPLADVIARRPPREALDGARSDQLDHRAVRGAVDPVGAVQADGPRRRSDRGGSVPVRGVHDDPLVARDRLQAALTIRNSRWSCRTTRGCRCQARRRRTSSRLAAVRRKVTLVPATFADLQDAFAEGVYDAWHFTGHGAARDENPDRSPILLAEGEQFTPESLSGAAANVGIPHPLVFINACQVGRAGMALTGIGGWANRFVEAGAGAFIGAYWSVYDEAAYAFATEVYTRLLKGDAVGRAVRVPGSRSARPGIRPGWRTRLRRSPRDGRLRSRCSTSTSRSRSRPPPRANTRSGSFAPPPARRPARCGSRSRTCRSASASTRSRPPSCDRGQRARAGDARSEDRRAVRQGSLGALFTGDVLAAFEVSRSRAKQREMGIASSSGSHHRAGGAAVGVLFDAGKGTTCRATPPRRSSRSSRPRRRSSHSPSSRRCGSYAMVASPSD